MPDNERTPQSNHDAPTLERLQKVLAARGVASRRAAETMIQDGRVSVDGRIVTELGTKVDPASAEIRVGGRLLKQPRSVYLILNKPRGYITTASDPEGRRTVYDLLDPTEIRERVYPVGRLDMDSEGLLLLTNDGEFANRIAHPRYRIDKEYNALVEGSPSPGALARLAHGGFMVDGGRTSPADVAVIGQEAGGTWLRIVIHEGRKRQVRRMLEEVGHKVRRLRRVRLGLLTLAGLPAATYRPLTPEELLRLRQMIGLAEIPRRTNDRQATPDRTPLTPEGRAPTRTLGEGRPRAPQGRANLPSPERREGRTEERRRQGGQPGGGRGGHGDAGGRGGYGGRKPGGAGSRRSRP